MIVVDMGVGNLGAFLTMLRRLGVPAQSSEDGETIARADRLILPGVGHFDHAARGLRQRGLEAVLHQKAMVEKVPILGVCLGMQLMLKCSEEGSEPGLGWVPGEVRRFDTGRLTTSSGGRPLPVPHMGWNMVEPTRSSTLFVLGESYRFYFVHSYHVYCADSCDAIATTTYGYPFVSAFQRDNLFGCQFHPEKSHRFGKQLLQRFADVMRTDTTNGRRSLAAGGPTAFAPALPA